MKNSRRSLRTSLLNAALLTTVVHPTLHAANLYFDTNGATAGSGNAAGAWDGATTNWSTDPTGSIATVGWTNGQSAVFSAGTDGVATKAVTIAGTVATPSILLEEVGLVNLTGGSIDITGGSVFNTSVLAGTTGRSLTWTSAITGTGPLTLAVNGDTSATGNGSNTIFALTGANDFTGDVTITSGILGTNSVLGNAANKVILNGGGLITNANGITLARDVQVGAAGGAIRTYGAVTDFKMTGALSGSGELRRTDGGTAILTGSGTGFTGALNLQRGTFQIGDGTQTANLIPNTSGITLGDATGAGSIRYNLDTSFTLATPVTFANNGSGFIWQGKDADDVLTVTGALGSAATAGTIRVNSGSLTAASGANIKALNLQTGSTPTANAAGVVGTFNILPGSSVTTRFFDIGQGAGNSGRVDQSGGLVTIEAGGNGFRFGHWDNGVSPGNVYNLSGGTLDASVTAVNIGWDGQADMTVGGGTGTATLKAGSIAVDANGNTTAKNDTLTLSPNGVIEVSGTVATASPEDKLFLNGGLLRATANATWSAGFTLNPGTTSTFDVPAGVTTNLSGLLLNPAGMDPELVDGGNLNVTGDGIFLMSTLGHTATGNFTRTGGTFAGNSTLSGTVTLNSTISPGTPGTPTPSIGSLILGGLGTTATLNGKMIYDLTAAPEPSTSDSIVTYGVTFGPSAMVSPRFNAIPEAGNHALVYYDGVITGTPAIDPTLQIRGLSFAIDKTSTAGVIQLAVTGTATPGDLVWGGDGTGNAWNVNSTANWAGGQKFFQYDDVVFNDSGNNGANITITGEITPGSVTIDGTKSYTFSGSGSLLGSAPLIKNSTGDLTILTNNKFGSVAINAGKVIVGNGGATGSIGELGNLNLPLDSTLEFNTSSNFAFGRSVATGDAGTLIKKGTGTMTVTTAATLLPTNITIDGGSMLIQGGGFNGNRMEGNGQITVNTGGTLAIGSAHALGGNNNTMTEDVTLNGGTLTLNSEQYFKNLTFNGALVNGSSEFRSPTANNWLVTGTTPTTINARVSNQVAANWTVEDVTGNADADVIINGTITNGQPTNKGGLGTMRITSANNANHANIINAGTIQITNNTALGFGGAIGNTEVAGTTVNTGATLDVAGVTINELVTLSSGGTLTNSNLTTTGTLSNGVAGVRITNAGSGYTTPPTLAFTGGGGTGATATATAGGTGTPITGITTTAAGSGYTTAPAVTVTGVGIDGSATAVVSRLAVLGADNKIGGEGNLTISAVMNGGGSYSKVGAGSLTIPTGGSNLSGNISVEAGTVTVTGQGNGITSGLGAVAGNRTVTLNGGTLAFGINNVFGSGSTAGTALPQIVVNPGATLAANNYNVLGALTLNGGTVTDTRTTAPGGYQGFEIKGPVTVAGTTPSLITAAGTFGHHLGATEVTFDVADVAAGADLVVAAKLLNSSADNASAAAGLTKTGAGTLALNGVNTISGTTKVSAGILGGTGSVAGPLLVEAAGTIAPGASAGTFGAGNTTILGTYACEIDGAAKDTLAVTGDLDVTGGTLAITQLAPASQSVYVIATYTGTLTGTFASVTGLPSGYTVSYATPGQIVLTNGGTADAYSTWAAANGIPGIGGAVDSDGDGIANAIEFVLGTDPSGPNSSSLANLPTVTVDATHLNFVFRRTDESMAMSAALQPYVQYGSDLDGWTTAVNGQPVATPVQIIEENNGFGAGIDRVTVKIPRSVVTPGVKLFARLRADIP